MPKKNRAKEKAKIKAAEIALHKAQARNEKIQEKQASAKPKSSPKIGKRRK